MSTKNYIQLQYKNDRTIVLVDMDCFYCQVEEQLNPELKGKPIAVVQYNAWQGGGIIAVNYIARAKGVNRHMRGEEAAELCPDIVLCKVPAVRGKADLTKYRDAGKEVAAVLQTFTPLLERASVDEAYLDISERVKHRLKDMNEGKFQLEPSCLTNTFAVGYENFGQFVKGISKTDSDDDELSEDERLSYKKSDIKLLIGAAIVNEIRAEVKRVTGYECSAGIAHNKILAKLTAGMHKPNQQTVLPLRKIPVLYETLPISKVKGLGGKFGENVCEKLKIKLMSELAGFSESELQKHFDDKNASWLHLMAQGTDLECVTPKYISKSIGCCKRFPGRNSINAIATLQHWLGELAAEIFERLEKDIIENNRIGKLMTVSYTQEINKEDVAASRSVPLPLPYDQDRIVKDAFETIKRNTEQFTRPDNANTLNNAIKFLGISCSKFEANPDSKEKNKLQAMFGNHSKRTSTDSAPGTLNNENAAENVPEKKAGEGSKGSIVSFFKNHAKKPPGDPANPPVAEQTVVASFFKKKLQADDGVPNAKPVEATSSIVSFFKKRNPPTVVKGIEETNMEQVKEESPQASTSTVVKELEVADTQTDEALPIDEEGIEDELFQESGDENENWQNGQLLPVPEHTIDDNQPSTSKATPPDYHHTYVEFHCPPNIEQLFETCSECHKKIPQCDIIEHSDMHLAFKLSQQQRDEFREAIKKRVASPNIAGKHKSRTGGMKMANISNFLVKTQPNADKSSAPITIAPVSFSGDVFAIDPLGFSPTKVATLEIGTEKCDYCHQDIPLQFYIDHCESHRIEESQRKQQQQQIQQSNKNTTVIVTGKNGANNKRKRTSSSSNANTIKVRNLNAFFTKG